MSLAGVDDVAYAYSSKNGDPYGFSTEALYADMAKPKAKRSTWMTYVRVRPEGEDDDLYEMWQAAQDARDQA